MESQAAAAAAAAEPDQLLVPAIVNNIGHVAPDGVPKQHDGAQDAADISVVAAQPLPRANQNGAQQGASDHTAPGVMPQQQRGGWTVLAGSHPLGRRGHFFHVKPDCSLVSHLPPGPSLPRPAAPTAGILQTISTNNVASGAGRAQQQQAAAAGKPPGKPVAGPLPGGGGGPLPSSRDQENLMPWGGDLQPEFGPAGLAFVTLLPASGTPRPKVGAPMANQQQQQQQQHPAGASSPFKHYR